jgi:ferredoxin
MPMQVLDRDGLDALIGRLAGEGMRVIGPVLGDGAIVLGEVAGVDDLPVGWTDEQEGGHYRLRRRDDEACFGYNLGPRSYKELRLPPRVELFSARRGDGGRPVGVRAETDAGAPAPRLALLGARPCELRAMGILDRVLLGPPHPDDAAQHRLAEPFVVAVQCGQAAATCFCTSMGTGPRTEAGFDLALTELLGDDGAGHRFTVEIGSPEGARVLSGLARVAAVEEAAEARAISARTAEQMTRGLETDGLRELLQRNAEHPRWDDVAERCLSCGNCTMVCPTCFCTSVDDETDLTGTETVRVQQWASCFTVDHSYVAGGSVRRSTRSRYRQWMTHKLSTWWDQFDSSGCVGCGRCITWCPVGIDITEEAAAIRATDGERRDADR